MEFKEELKKYQQQVNQKLLKYLYTNECLESELNKSFEYSLMAGGKRIRPILVIATFALFSDDFEKCIDYAVAIEMVHNFSLIHDDLPAIDNDDYRHGKLTNHKKFNESTAILAGDRLLNEAYKIISGNLIKEQNNKVLNLKLKVFNEFSIAVERMIAGEYVDTEFEGKSITEKELEYIHINKTGALLRLSARMGAIIAGASDIDISNITTYAEKIGLAFQIKDDILSEEGTFEELGKPIGNDKELEKCTYVSLYGLESAKNILKETVDEAINAINIYGDKAEFLKELAKYIMNRNK